MSVLKPEQQEYLIGIYGDGLTATCGHQDCQDVMEMAGMTLATALDTYRVGGDQFAAITMDLLCAVQKIGERVPGMADVMGLTSAVHAGILIAAVAYRRYRDENPEEDGPWPSES
jgi:hypothetical protein